MKETWKPVAGYEGIYLVSNLGNVKSLARGKEYLHANGIDKDGYRNVRLTRKLYKTHRLVAIAFIANPENKPLINHKDGNKLNNCVTNLEWCTAKENGAHAAKSGLLKQGRQNPHSGITQSDAAIIRMMKSQGCSTKELAQHYKVSKTSILRIVRNQTWKQSA